jgi:hypothetical protein
VSFGWCGFLWIFALQSPSLWFNNTNTKLSYCRYICGPVSRLRLESSPETRGGNQNEDGASPRVVLNAVIGLLAGQFADACERVTHGVGAGGNADTYTAAAFDLTSSCYPCFPLLKLLCPSRLEYTLRTYISTRHNFCLGLTSRGGVSFICECSYGCWSIVVARLHLQSAVSTGWPLSAVNFKCSPHCPTAEFSAVPAAQPSGQFHPFVPLYSLYDTASLGHDFKVSPPDLASHLAGSYH